LLRRDQKNGDQRSTINRLIHSWKGVKPDTCSKRDGERALNNVLSMQKENLLNINHYQAAQKSLFYYGLEI
jgi:hypothetical protein